MLESPAPTALTAPSPEAARAESARLFGHFAPGTAPQPSPRLRFQLHRLFEARYALIRLTELAQERLNTPGQPAGLHQAQFHANSNLAMPMGNPLINTGEPTFDRRRIVEALSWLVAELLLAEAGLATHGAVHAALRAISLDARPMEAA